MPVRAATCCVDGTRRLEPIFPHFAQPRASNRNSSERAGSDAMMSGYTDYGRERVNPIRPYSYLVSNSNEPMIGSSVNAQQFCELVGPTKSLNLPCGSADSALSVNFGGQEARIHSNNHPSPSNSWSYRVTASYSYGIVETRNRERKGSLNQIRFSFPTVHKSVLERKCTQGSNIRQNREIFSMKIVGIPNSVQSLERRMQFASHRTGLTMRRYKRWP